MSRLRHSWNSDNAPTGPVNISTKDYSYITPEDIGKDNLFWQSPDSYNSSETADDVIYLVYEDKKLRTCFPPYSIADGKVCVRDLRTRAGLLFNITGKPLQAANLKYKGRPLGGEDDIVRQFNVKNKSEITICLSESGDDSRSSKKSKPKRRTRGLNDSESAEQAGASSSSRPETKPASTKGSTPMEKINIIEKWFDTEMLDKCQVFMKTPPSDGKKREQEWRKLTEITMQHVFLKLDAVDANGDQDVRNRRKEVCKRIEDIMKMLDEAKK